MCFCYFDCELSSVEEPKKVVDGMAIDALERFGIREEQKFPFLGKYVLVKCLTFLFYF